MVQGFGFRVAGFRVAGFPEPCAGLFFPNILSLIAEITESGNLASDSCINPFGD